MSFQRKTHSTSPRATGRIDTRLGVRSDCRLRCRPCSRGALAVSKASFRKNHRGGIGLGLVTVMAALVLTGSGALIAHGESPTHHTGAISVGKAKRETVRALRRLLPDVGVRTIFGDCSPRAGNRANCSFSISHRSDLSPECGDSNVRFVPSRRTRRRASSAGVLRMTEGGRRMRGRSRIAVIACSLWLAPIRGQEASARSCAGFMADRRASHTCAAGVSW